jgi:hypothetical protein
MAKKSGIGEELDALEKLLNTAAEDGKLAVDPENLAEPIDMEEINSESEKCAIELVSNLSKIYFDDKFMEENPGLKKRIDTFIESMRILIKMRKSSERTHDILVAAIPSQPTNASLYRSQAQIESNLLSIQKQMDETVANMTNLLKGYQLELNFRSESDDDDTQEKEPDIEKDTHRGSKTFIQQMQERNSKVDIDLFTGVADVDEFTGEPLETEES